MKRPFQCLGSSPEVICLVVMTYVRYPLSRRAEGAGSAGTSGDRRQEEQQGREFTPTVQATRTADTEVSEYEDTPETHLSAGHCPQPLQPEAPSRQPRHLQAKTLGRLGRVERSHGPKAGRVRVCGMLTETGWRWTDTTFRSLVNATT